MVVGNSHASAFWVAALDAQTTRLAPGSRTAVGLGPNTEPIEWMTLLVDEREPPTPANSEIRKDWKDDYGELVSEIAAETESADVVVVVWRGFQVDALALIEVGDPFDFFENGTDDGVDSDRTLVPFSAVEDAMKQRVEVDRLSLLLRAMPRERTVVLAPPPPLPVEAVRDRLIEGEWFRSQAAQLGFEPESMPLVDDQIRAKMWRVLCRCHEIVAAENGVRFVMPPDDVLADSGLRHPRFWGTDALHANPAYAARCLDALLSDEVMTSASVNSRIATLRHENAGENQGARA
jgi:hypothetical protein